MRGAALLLALALPLATLAEERKVTLLFTGDNGGEVSPCG
jgi:hypothetical protein